MAAKQFYEIKYLKNAYREHSPFSVVFRENTILNDT